MAYTDYSYYVEYYLLGRSPVVSEEDFPFFEKQAEKELDKYTFGRLRDDESLISDDVKDCACAIAELLYKSDKASFSADSCGLAGPLVSWSNDGESGSVDLSNSIYTATGKQSEIRRLVFLHLGNTGLLYQGVN